jgi:hypothetical protein
MRHFRITAAVDLTCESGRVRPRDGCHSAAKGHPVAHAKLGAQKAPNFFFVAVPKPFAETRKLTYQNVSGCVPATYWDQRPIALCAHDRSAISTP